MMRYILRTTVDPVTGFNRTVQVLQEKINGVWTDVPTVSE